MKSRHFSPAYAGLFRETGEPTLRSSANLRSMQKACVGRKDPNTFFVTVDPRPEAKIVWSYNTKAHFGRQALTYKSFFAAIHPFWLPVYVGLAEFTFQLNKPMTDENIAKELSLTANVPLRNRSGKYHWYNQVSFAGSFDARGRMIEYLNEFHRMAEFDRMVPTRPELTSRGKRVEAYDIQLVEQLGGLLEKPLRTLLSPTSYKLLHAYRLMQAVGRSTNRESVAKALGIRLQALDKGNVRLLSQARLAFPAAALTSVTNLAGFLNEMFGRPLARRSRSMS